MKFAVKITLNDLGKSVLFGTLQAHITALVELPTLLKQYRISDEHIKTIEIIESSHWDGYKH